MTYKIIQEGLVVDVVHNPNFVRFLPSGHIAFTDKSSAQGILGSDNKTVYSFDTPSGAKIYEISMQEFDRLKSLLSSTPEVGVSRQDLLDARKVKIAELSTICKDKIVDGFSVILSDGKAYCFKLTIEDQINLISIENQLDSDAEAFVYHATDQPCRCFSKIDMAKIIKTFKQHISYHTTYFNTAKQYINSLVDIEKINLFTYGTDVSETVENIVIKQIFKNGGNL